MCLCMSVYKHIHEHECANDMMNGRISQQNKTQKIPRGHNNVNHVPLHH